jgi:hypothetical protein
VPYEMDTYFPEARGRAVTVDELPGLFTPECEPVFVYHEDAGEDVVIASVHDGFSTVSLRRGDTWYWLEESPETEPVEITLCGLEAWVPAGVRVRPATGLAALLLAHDPPALLARFSWREQ